MIQLKKNHIYGDYCCEMLILQLQKYMREYDAQRTNVVFNTYKQVSLESSVRNKHGREIQLKVSVNSIAPTNWRNS